MRNFFFVSAGILAAIAYSSAQSESEALYIKKNTSLKITVDNDKLRITESHLSEKQFFTNFEKHANAAVYYSAFDPVIHLEAVTLVPSKSGFKKQVVTSISTEDIFQSGVFYADYRRRRFVFPSLINGAIGKLEYTKQITDPHLINTFFFDETIPVTKAEFSVTFPQEVSLRYKLLGADTAKITISKKRNGDKTTTFTWTLTDIAAYQHETDAPSHSYSAPHIAIYIESFQTKAGIQHIIANVSDLYQWYESHIRQIPAGNTTDLKKMVADLTHAAKSEEEKIRVIFQWVQANIRYIAFEDGMAGFVPRSSADVLTKRYGDCKDMANLLKDMLRFADVDAYHTWIGTRSKPYTSEQIPTTVLNNHMICSVKTNGQYIFLDATNPFLAFGKPSEMIQNKEALIGFDHDTYEIVKVPVVNRLENQRRDTVRIALQPDGLRGQFKSSLTGFRKDDLEIIHLRALVKNDNEYLRDFFEIGGNNISIDHSSIDGLGNSNIPASIYFDFLQPGYYKNINDKIYINLHLNKTIKGEKADLQKRTQLIEQQYQFEDHFTAILTIPEGCTVSFIPSDASKTWPEFGVNAHYRKDGQKIILERTIYSNFLYLDKTQFEQWNNFLAAINAVYQQSITLIKSTQ